MWLLVNVTKMIKKHPTFGDHTSINFILFVKKIVHPYTFQGYTSVIFHVLIIAWVMCTASLEVFLVWVTTPQIFIS